MEAWEGRWMEGVADLGDFADELFAQPFLEDAAGVDLNHPQ